MIGDKYDICCEECRRYLFTVEEVPYENRERFSLGKEVRINDHKNYEYTKDGKFVCDKCKSNSI